MGTAPMEASGSGNGSSSGAARTGPESAAGQALSPILPFLGPIEELLLDPAVTEIRVNAAADVYVERRGVLETADVPGWTNRELERALVQIARSLDSRIILRMQRNHTDNDNQSRGDRPTKHSHHRSSPSFLPNSSAAALYAAMSTWETTRPRACS